MRMLYRLVCSLFAVVYSSMSFAVNVPREYFPIERYSQEINTYISPKRSDYKQNLLTPEYQNLRLKQFYNHYYSSDANGLSPWSEALVREVLTGVRQSEEETLKYFSKQKHYAENFREHTLMWWCAIQKNLNLNAIDPGFKPQNRAIVTSNTAARALPTVEPDFFDEQRPGEGFPFDNLQIASLWVGTPLYVLHISKDKAWSLVLTPDAYLAWVKSSDIAYASPDFVKKWQTAARKKLVAVTKTEVPVEDSQGRFQFTGYIGGVFPLLARDAKQTRIMMPAKNSAHFAVIKPGVIATEASGLMPLPVSPQNMASVIQELQHRPYGWGGAFFLNDCSQELKSLFTPFGIWLPRNSGLQVKLNKHIDLSEHSLEERLALLKEKGHPLVSLIYKPGHIVLYVGNAEVNHQQVVMSYQNVWGLSSKSGDNRYVIGGGVFLPILSSYPGTPANSQANESRLNLVYLDEESKDLSPEMFARYI